MRELAENKQTDQKQQKTNLEGCFLNIKFIPYLVSHPQVAVCSLPPIPPPPVSEV